jgi:exoribonuclease R
MESQHKIVKIIDNQMVLASLSNPTVPQSELVQPCLFDGDIVQFNSQSSQWDIVSSPIRTSTMVGYFSTSQQVKFGKTSSGATIYQVSPFNQKLPYFLISYNGKQTGKLIITFKFNQWTKGLPRGEIVQVIGPMDLSNLVPTLQWNYGINRKEYKHKPVKNSYEISGNFERKVIDETVFSIDPVGCIDIDDAMSWSENSNGYNIKIHIAQPTYWLSESDLVSRAKTAFSTLYQEPTQHNSNLWGDEITKASSLLAGALRPAYTMEFVISKLTSEITCFQHYPSLVTNTHAVNYSNCLSITCINDFYTITKTISGKPDIDTHELVSYWMVLANNYLGKSEQVQKLNIPYRVTNSTIPIDTNSPNPMVPDVLDDKEVATAFANMQLESATYQINQVENYHQGLGINNYIHFTSPIRRIVDTIVHWCLTYNINFNYLVSTYGLDINTINKLDKSTKKFHHEINMLEKINKLELKPNESIELTGWVYSNIGNRWTVYFKELGFSRVKMWDFKFNYLLQNLSGEKINEKKVGEKTRNFAQCGEKISFKVCSKPGFLPKEKILIVPLLNLM